jgi:hypothetical protein
MIDESVLKLTFGVGISFYNDVRGLERCLRSVYGNVEYVMCVDGKYSYNDFNDEPLSTDGSREYVRSIAKEFEGRSISLIDAPNLTEAKKRQVYVDATKEYGIDVLLILDSDEYVFCADWFKFRHECYQKMMVRDGGNWNIYNIPFREPMSRPRLWWQAYKIAVGPCHYDFTLKDDVECREINLGGDAMHEIGNIVISHRHDLRTADSQFARETWEKKQQIEEDAHRSELRQQMKAERRARQEVQKCVT